MKNICRLKNRISTRTTSTATSTSSAPSPSTTRPMMCCSCLTGSRPVRSTQTRCQSCCACWSLAGTSSGPWRMDTRQLVLGKLYAGFSVLSNLSSDETIKVFLFSRYFLSITKLSSNYFNFKNKGWGFCAEKALWETNFFSKHLIIIIAF